MQNAGGKLLADGDLVVTAQSLNNTDGLIDSQKSVRLNLFCSRKIGHFYEGHFIFHRS
ncbi:hypothetical protein [Xenorhabdus griffiniae]|uniref:hypothetical protein n=1 Tax=Xenorhabdus griffiniae TaxID=351672 RepID=UPI003BB0A6A3